MNCNRITVFLCGLVALCALAPAGATPITIDTVPVGNAGNAGEVQSQGNFGAVADDYRIGTYEITNTAPYFVGRPK